MVGVGIQDTTNKCTAYQAENNGVYNDNTETSTTPITKPTRTPQQIATQHLRQKYNGNKSIYITRWAQYIEIYKNKTITTTNFNDADGTQTKMDIIL